MTKLQDTQLSIEELKRLAEKLYSTPENLLLDQFENYELFKDKLNGLLSTIAKYRIQLNSSEDKSTFGPKTLKAVETLVSDYDKLYEIYEEHLFNMFAPVEPLYNEMMNKIKVEGSSQDEANQISLSEETRTHLRQIDEYKKRMEETKTLTEVDFDKIQKNETELNDLFNRILKIYREDPCKDLEKILLEIYEENQEDFVRIVENIGNLIREISRKPDEVGLRILRINNEKLQKDFLENVNSVKLLKFSGFRIATTAEIQKHLSSMNCKFDDEYFLYLHEPDMFALYSKWKDWLNNVNNVSSALNNFILNFKRLKRVEKDPKTLISKSL